MEEPVDPRIKGNEDFVAPVTGYFTQEQATKEALVAKKSLLAEREEGLTDEEFLQQAEADVEKLLEEHGSMLAVSYLLQFESLAKEAGVLDELVAIMEEVFSDEAISANRTAIEEELVQKVIASKDFSVLIDNLPREDVAYVMREIMDRVNLSEAEGLRSKTQSAEFAAIWNNYREFILLSRTNDLRQYLKEVFSQSPPPPPPKRDDPEGNGQIEDSTTTITRERPYSETASGGSPDKDPPPNEEATPDVISAGASNNETRSSLSSPESPPPPPPPDDPEQYEKLIDPEILSSVEWPNGDGLEVTSAEILTDDQGRTREFFNVVYRYKPEGSEDYVRVDLSSYVPGKNILFEGTKGAMSGNYTEKEALGWAKFDPEEGGSYLVALSTRELSASPLRGMSLIFHELGHINVAGDIEQRLYTEGKARRNIPLSLGPLSEKIALKPIRGLEQYAQAFQEEARRYVENMPISKLDRVSSLVESALASDALESLSKPTWNFSRQDQLRIKEKIPVLRQLVSIFHERNACAYAVKQIRLLKPSDPSAKEALDYQKEVLGIYTRIYKDARYQEGVTRK